MKIAYIFQIYKDFEYHAKVFRMLKEPWCDIYVHIDKKSKIDLKKYIKEYNLEDIHFLKDRISVYWAGFTQIQATLKLFKEVQKSGQKYDRIIFMTDNEFPCWSNQKIYEFFEQNKGKEFMKVTNPKDFDVRFEYSISRMNTYTFFDCPLFKNMPRIKLINMMVRWQRFQREVLSISRKLLPFHYYRGNAKFYITQEFMDYVLDYVKHNPKDLNTFKHTAGGDEVFFTTLLMNSRFKENRVDKLFRYHKWLKNAPTVKVLTIEDLPNIEKVDPFVCAKIVPETSAELIEYLMKKRQAV